MTTVINRIETYVSFWDFNQALLRLVSLLQGTETGAVSLGVEKGQAKVPAGDEKGDSSP